jgi:polar amino acid transport system substrate-binding protein
MKKFLLSIVMVGLMVGLLAACGQGDKQGSEEKKIVMGTSADYPPFETRDNAGKIVGFDADLAKKIAEKLGYELEIKDMSFDGLIGALQSGTVDFVASGMTATEERKENVDFSTEYIQSEQMFVTLKDSKVKSIDDLEGATIGTQLGSIQEEGAKKLAKKMNIEVKSLNKVPDLIQELKAGRIDAVYLDLAVAQGYVNEADLAGFKDESNETPGMAIAFPKDGKLVSDFNKVIEEMQKNGELEKLNKQWLEEE